MLVRGVDAERGSPFWVSEVCARVRERETEAYREGEQMKACWGLGFLF